jgi:hypothetical protein
MSDLLGLIAALDRPSLLVRAARLGVRAYSRAAHLPRLLDVEAAPPTGPAILRLLTAEAELEGARRAGALYEPGRHVAVLAALLGEARVLRAGLRLALAA